MPESQSRTLVNQVFDKLFDLLMTGEIPLGGVVNEAALASRFNVSRGPVREAVKQFEGRGIVIKEPYLKARVVALSVSDMIEIFQLREAVEGMSVRLATLNMSDDALDELLSDFSDATTMRTDQEVLDVHVRIAQGSGNARIRTLLCDELYYLLRLYRARSGKIPERRSNAHAEHWQILRAMKARDPDLAESLMRNHITRATQTLEALLAQSDADAPVQTKKETG